MVMLYIKKKLHNYMHSKQQNIIHLFFSLFSNKCIHKYKKKMSINVCVIIKTYVVYAVVDLVVSLLS